MAFDDDALNAVNNAANTNNSETLEQIHLIDDFGAIDIFGTEYGGMSSGVDDMILEKFKAGINENVHLTNIRFRREDTWSGVELLLKNAEGLEQPFCLFTPNASTRKDAATGKDIPTWNPKIMKDPNGRPLENKDANKRQSGGVQALNPDGSRIRNAQNQQVYRNETEEEAQRRNLTEFKTVLNSIMAAFCKEKMPEAWAYFLTIDNGAAPKNWGEYTTRLIQTITEFAPQCNTEKLAWTNVPLRVKLYRKYDSTTSNKRSERFLEIPRNLEKGLFMEKMGDPNKYLIKIDTYEQENYINAPAPKTIEAGVNNSGLNLGTPIPQGLPGVPGLGFGMGLPQIPK